MSSIQIGISTLRNALRRHLGQFAKDEEGVTMLEYTILIGIITVAVILSVVFAGSWVSSQWGLLTSALTIA